jgi:anti-anti-sigma factor
MTFEPFTIPCQDTPTVRLPAGRGDQLRVRVDHPEYGTDGAPTVVRLDGELDMVTAPGLYQCVRWYLKPDTTVLVDLGGVTFCGTSGLATLVDLSDIAAGNGGGFALVVATRAMQRALSVTRLDERFRVYPDVESARSECVQ